MSFSNPIRIPLVLPTVDIFTFGESSLFGYDSLNNSLIVCSLIEFNNTNDQLIDRLHLSLLTTSSIRRLVLNPDETVLALIAEKTAYLVYLPQTKNSPSKGSRLCPANVIPSLKTNSTSVDSILIDFIWLSSTHFAIVCSIPSSSECHLYQILPSKAGGINHVQTFSVGIPSIGDRKTNGTPNKKIALRQSSDIVKLDVAKRKQGDLKLILLFAMKADGDIYMLEINQNQLLNNEIEITSEFGDPIRILPSTHDNYGADHTHSNLICLSCSPFPIIIFTRDKCQIYECVFLNPTIDQYYLFTIDSISLPIDENNQIIKSMIIDKLNSNVYYVCDSSSNIYSIEIFWNNNIQDQGKKIQSTNVQHIIKSNDFIQQIGLIQTSTKGQWLAFITKTKNNHEKELILIRPNSLSLTSSSSTFFESLSLNETKQINKSNSSSEYLDRIRKILIRDQSLPHTTISTSSSIENISNSDFEKNLFNFLTIISEQYIEKQEKLHIELENKQRYLYDFQQTQLIANQEISQKFEQVQEKFQILNQQYEQEYARRKDLAAKFGDLLSVIEQHTPVMSDEEILMYQQLERYRVQINSLQKKISLLKQFIIQQQPVNIKKEQVDQSFIETIHIFVQYYRDKIYEMKKELPTIDRNN
ncbi:unnamed protein product [Rotaria socialis]|uniref:Uncharacterized protein n=1 Tax=Rotaria socialis TaxID=392032 RepID=A0A820I9U8_9BILA|nr:unnamed protein product [Rotaria socialis]CAF3367025.1 unnamed protein product [Rotaria socialis]CAF3684914.1 unnamed protein product [Rotaria socialis]CAF4305651.1 unnamed protein product [Rotaria socialis]CAF4437302.1 unnamed protein product [Rotaria socialis]